MVNNLDNSYLLIQQWIKDKCPIANLNNDAFLLEWEQCVKVSPISFEDILSKLSDKFRKSKLNNEDVTPNTLFEEINNQSSAKQHINNNLPNLKLVPYNNSFKELLIEYNVYQTIYGCTLIANMDNFICYISFIDTIDELSINKEIDKISNLFHLNILQKRTFIQQTVFEIIDNQLTDYETLSLLVSGTAFYLSVWNELINIPLGSLTTYKNIADKLNAGKAYQAIGNAVGANHIGYLLPCHRVIQTNGGLANFRWGIERKMAMLLRESFVGM